MEKQRTFWMLFTKNTRCVEVGCPLKELLKKVDCTEEGFLGLSISPVEKVWIDAQHTLNDEGQLQVGGLTASCRVNHKSSLCYGELQFKVSLSEKVSIP